MAIAVLSSAGIVTTPKAAAADPAPYVYAVDYARAPVGTTYKWTVMNFHSPSVSPYIKKSASPDIQKSDGRHMAWVSSDHHALVSMRFLPEFHYWYYNSIGIGVILQPDPGYTSVDWATLKERKVAVTFTVKTTLETNGEPDHVWASAVAAAKGTSYPMYSSMEYASIEGRDTYSKLQTLTFTDLGNGPLTLENVHERISIFLMASINEIGITRVQSASANVVVQSIELTFLS